MGERLVIGEFNESYKPIMDGVGVCVENYARGLHAAGHDLSVMVPHVPAYADDDPFTVVRFPSLPLPGMPPYRIGLPWTSPWVNSYLSHTPFSIVHSHSPFVAGRMARRTALRHGVPHVSTFHTKYRDDIARLVKSARVTDAIINRIVRFYQKCDSVWTPSTATERTLREYGYTGEVMIAPNGSDLRRPTPAEREAHRAAGRAELGIAADAFVFLFVGQHRWEKNPALILNGLGALKRRPDASAFTALFVGEGVNACAMHELALSNGLGSEVQFVGRVVDREAMKQMYAASDLFLFPSLYDNAPLVMREAAAFAVPAVVAAGSSAAEIIEDRRNGFVVENEPEAFGALLVELMHHPALIDAAGQGASRTVYIGWDEIVEWVAEQYHRIIERALGGASGSARAARLES